MSHEHPPTGCNEVVFDFSISTNEPNKARAFRLLCQIAFEGREATPAETALILNYVNPVLRNNLGCWFSIWSPADVQEFAEGERDGFEPTYEQALRICHDLDCYDNIHSEVSDSVRNELQALRNSGAHE